MSDQTRTPGTGNDARPGRGRAALLWTLFGVAAVAAVTALVLWLAGLASSPDDEPEPTEPTPTEPAPDPDPEPDPDPDPGDPDPEPGDPGPADPPGEVPVTVRADGRDLVLDGPDGSETLVTLPAEGESTWLTVSVRPGSTPDDLTLVTTTMAEGMVDLRWSRIVNGQVEVGFEALEGAHGVSSGAQRVDRPVWSPDGDSIAWVEGHADGQVLRIIGWDDGPGTGDTATDNTSFVLDEVATGDHLAVQDWVAPSAGEPERTHIRATLDDFSPQWWRIELVRQADGAWSLASSPVEVDGPAVEATPGTLPALAGVGDEGLPRWMLWLTDAGPVLLEDPYVEQEVTSLPDELLPGDGIPRLWLRESDGGVLVVSASMATAWWFDGTELTPLADGGSDRDLLP